MSGWKLPQIPGVDGLTYSARVQYHTPRERELYAHARAEALEEAANFCEQRADAEHPHSHYEDGVADGYNRAAIGIRALKESE